MADKELNSVWFSAGKNRLTIYNLYSGFEGQIYNTTRSDFQDKA